MNHPTDCIPTEHFHIGCAFCGQQSLCFPAEDEESPFLTTPREVIDHAATMVAHTMRVHGPELMRLGAFEAGISDDEFISRVTMLKQEIAARRATARMPEVLRRMFPWLP